MESVEAGTDEQKANEEVEQPQALTPPQQHRALAASSVRNARATAARHRRTANKTARQESTLADTDPVIRHTTNLFDDWSSSSEHEEDAILVNVNTLAHLELQHEKDKIVIKDITNDNEALTREILHLHGEVSALREQVALQESVLDGQAKHDADNAREELYLAISHVQQQQRRRGQRLLVQLRDVYKRQHAVVGTYIAGINHDIDEVVANLIANRPDHPGSPPEKK